MFDDYFTEILYCEKCECRFYFIDEVQTACTFDLWEDSCSITVRFNFMANSTIIIANFRANDKRKDFSKRFDQIIDISPKNAYDKLKLLMLLS